MGFLDVFWLLEIAPSAHTTPKYYPEIYPGLGVGMPQHLSTPSLIFGSTWRNWFKRTIATGSPNSGQLQDTKGEFWWGSSLMIYQKSEALNRNQNILNNEHLQQVKLCGQKSLLCDTQSFHCHRDKWRGERRWERQMEERSGFVCSLLLFCLVVCSVTCFYLITLFHFYFYLIFYYFLFSFPFWWSQ